jgi:DNA polymerase-3 subunit gamma/tau
MLTREAWNALLKILEEPPPRVIFVFATTEPQKIAQSAAPILSRCQRFDFRRIGVSDIVTRLEGVLEREGVSAAEDALRIVARKADGGMRDALSRLDQVMSLTGGEIDADSVRRVLGLVEEERYLELLDILREGRHGDVFDLVDRLVDEGYDLVEFYHGLLDILRVVLRLRLSPDADVDLKEDLRADLVERASSFEPTDLVRMLVSAAELESLGSLRRSPNPRVPIEMLLLRMSYMDRTVSFEELLGALGGTGAPAGASGKAGAPAGSAAPPSTATPRRPSTEAQPSPKPSPKKSAEAAESASPAAAPGSEQPTATNGHPRSASAAEAWQDWLDHGPGVPRGLGSFLRAATVTDGPGGGVHISGLAEPAGERLGEPAVQQAIREGLAGRLGRSPELVFDAPSSTRPKAARPTEAEVRDQTLKALFRQEPSLEKAVEELDLELMD